MSSQLTVVVAGIVLVVAIVVALVIMRRGDSRFTYDTQHGTAPRATEGEGNTALRLSRAAFPSSPRVWARCLPRLPLSCGACRWSRRTTTTSRPRAIRPAPLPRLPCVVASWTATASRWCKTAPRSPSLPIATLPTIRYWCVILRTYSACRMSRCCATSRTIPRARRACIRSRPTCAALPSPTFRSMPASFPA